LKRLLWLKNNQLTCYSVRLTSKTVVLDMIKYGDLDTKKWRVPCKCYNNLTFALYWLKAFFSCEAYVTEKVIRIQTVNKEGMQDIKKLLDCFDISSNVYSYVPKNPNHSEVFIIVIQKKSSRFKFREKIGFWHSKKSEMLDKALSL